MSFQDTRSEMDKVLGLFDIAGNVRDGLAASGVQSGEGMVQARRPKSTDNLLGLDLSGMPQSPMAAAREKYGKGELFFRDLLSAGGSSIFASMLLPDVYGEGAQDKYKTDMELYKAGLTSQLEQQQAQAERDRMSGLGAGLRDAFGTETLDDDLEAVIAARTGGMDLADIKHLQNMVGQSYQDPSWETKFDNGVLVRYDKNSNSPAQVVLGDDGKPITEKMDGDMRKTSAWFERAVPALENMHKLEDRGVTLDRNVLTFLQQAQDENGMFKPLIYNQLLNEANLTGEQKQYLRNARDLAMIQLRKESGAAIGVSEMFNELEQNVMLSDMSDEGYEYQRGKARLNKYRGLANGLPSYLLDEFKEKGYFDTLDNLRKNSSRNTGPYDYTDLSDSDFDKIYERIEPGTVFIGPDGKEYQK
jgi:hypothetical protein